MENRPTRTVKTTKTVFAILEALREHDGTQVTTIADDLELAKSTVHRHLVTLLEEGYVVKENDEYNLGMRFHHLGEHARDRKKGYKMAKQKIQELAEDTGERALFTVCEHGYLVKVHHALGERAVKIDPSIGRRFQMHATAAGKAILAHLPPEEREAIVDQHGLTQVTPNTITDSEEFFAELDQIRERGYATNMQENISGLRSVSAPVLNPDDSVLGALTISGPTHRIEGERLEHELPSLILGTANELELNITHSD